MTTLENPSLRTEGAPVQGAAFGATAALIVGTFAVVMSATTINIAIVPMMQEFAVGDRVAQLFSSLFLGTTVLTAPLAAWLSRRFGARQVFLGVLLLYALASLAATFSDSFLSMLLARGLQGACAGVIQPLSMFLVLAAAPPERQGRAMSLYGLGVVLAPALGPTIAGWFVDHVGWRSTFSLGVPPALLALGLGWFCLPRSAAEQEEGGSFDWPGLALLAVLVTLVFATPLALERSTALAAALCLLWLGTAWLFWRVERARQDALLPFALFASPGFRAAALVSVAYGAGMYGSTFLIPVFMQGALGIPALTTGNILLLGGVALALSTSLAGRVVGPPVRAPGGRGRTGQLRPGLRAAGLGPRAGVDRRGGGALPHRPRPGDPRPVHRHGPGSGARRLARRHRGDHPAAPGWRSAGGVADRRTDGVRRQRRTGRLAGPGAGGKRGRGAGDGVRGDRPAVRRGAGSGAAVALRPPHPCRGEFIRLCAVIRRMNSPLQSGSGADQPGPCRHAMAQLAAVARRRLLAR